MISLLLSAQCDRCQNVILSTRPTPRLVKSFQSVRPRLGVANGRESEILLAVSLPFAGACS